MMVMRMMMVVMVVVALLMLMVMVVATIRLTNVGSTEERGTHAARKPGALEQQAPSEP